MQKNYRLVVDNFAEVHGLLKPWINEEFWDFSKVEPRPGSVYMIGRQQLLDNHQKVVDMAASGQYTVIFNNSAEGAWTLETQIKQLKLHELAVDKKLLLIGGAPVTTEYACLVQEHFLPSILDYDENIQAQASTELIYSTTQKPYKFLFLNGRARPHRKYLYEKFRRNGVLDQSLWTMLDAKPTVVRSFNFEENGINVMATASQLQHLPANYEVDRYRNPVFGPIVPDRTNLKQELFDLEWGEIYLEPAPYVDTYFSLVTETICAESVYSFRTEKMAKPLAMGHPFVLASTPNYLADLRRIGFQTFGHVIDESYDQIENAQERMDRVIDIVTDLCKQDLASFLQECYNVCKYNQQHLAEIRTQVRKAFPDRFFQFVNQHRHD
jgi:hypothetical protein